MGFDGGRAGYSAEALNVLTDWMRNLQFPADWPKQQHRVDEEAAVRACYGERKANAPTLKLLPEPPTTGNDVVDVALRETWRIVNQGITRLGAPPDEIIVELGREMTQSYSARGEALDAIKNNEEQREVAATTLIAAGAVADPPAIHRYLLAVDQDFRCPYCQGTNHLELSDIVDGHITNDEHILPKNLTGVRKKRSELVLAHQRCNHAKGEQTPGLAWGDGKDDVRWSAVKAMAALFKQKAEKAKTGRDFAAAKRLTRKAHLLLLQDYEAEVLTDESVADFADRQLHATSQIAKEIVQWMRTICANVFVARGELTAQLRTAWGLNTVIPEARFEEGRLVHVSVLERKKPDDEKPKFLLKQITREEFEKWQPTWEGARRERGDERTALNLEKRLDHRHHLVDACVIALSDRCIFKGVAKHYKLADEQLRADIRFDEQGKRIRRWRLPPPPP